MYLSPPPFPTLTTFITIGQYQNQETDIDKIWRAYSDFTSNRHTELGETLTHV